MAGHRAEFPGDQADWTNDSATVVLAPASAENSRHVPVLIDATELDRPVLRIVVTIEYSPLPGAPVFYPGRALPFLGFGVKYETDGALRASAQISDESWKVGAVYVGARGGGCSAPAATHVQPDWHDGFGQIRAHLWPQTGKLRLTIGHPQDTGLADGIPAHHLTELALQDANGAVIAHLELHEPIEENPAFTFQPPPDLAAGPVTIAARDNLGNRFHGTVEALA